MSTTTTPDNSALKDHLVLGETLFLATGVLAFLTEFILTFRSLMLPNLVGTCVGACFMAGMVYVLNRLYTGDKQARQLALIWAGVQVGVAVIGVILLYRNNKTTAHLLSVPADLVGIAKAAAYVAFGFVISQKTPALAFLRSRGGETVEAPTPTAPLEDIAKSGLAVPLAKDQLEQVGSLSSTLASAGIAFLLAGFFEAVVGGLRIPASAASGWLLLLEGAVLLMFGLTLLYPSRSVRNVAEQGADTNYLADAIEKLGCMSLYQIALGVAWAGLTIASILVKLRS